MPFPGRRWEPALAGRGDVVRPRARGRWVMRTMPSSREDARAFLAARRIALVGLSRREQDFSRMVLRELARRGYDVVPVHPGMKEAEGRTCYPRIQDVRPAPEAALLMTAPAVTEEVVRGCAEAGVRRVWMHRGAGPGAASEGAIAFCEAHGIAVVRDLCPFMALPGAGFPHRVHGFFRRALAPRAQREARPAR